MAAHRPFHSNIARKRHLVVDLAHGLVNLEAVQRGHLDDAHPDVTRLLVKVRMEARDWAKAVAKSLACLLPAAPSV